jgi:hypothetical protein
MTEDSRTWPPKAYRTREEANAWLPRARAILEEIQRRTPGDRIAIDMPTLFVGTIVPEIVGCVAVTLVGIPRHLAALEFLIDDDFEATVDTHVRRLLRWHERVEAQIAGADDED